MSADDVIVFLFVIIFMIPVIYVFTNVKDGKHKKVFTTNKIMISAAVPIFLFMTGESIYDKNFNVYGNNAFSPTDISYSRTEADRYILRVDEMFRASSEISVPEESVGLPQISYIYRPIKVYCRENSPLLAGNIIKIAPNFDRPLFILICGDIIVLQIYDIIIFFGLILEKKESDAYEKSR